MAAAEQKNQTFVEKLFRQTFPGPSGWDKYEFKLGHKVYENGNVVAFHRMTRMFSDPDDAGTIVLVFRSHGRNWEVQYPKINKVFKNKVSPAITFPPRHDDWHHHFALIITESKLNSPEFKEFVQSWNNEEKIHNEQYWKSVHKKEKEEKKSANKRLTWNEFREKHKGQNLSIKELSEKYQQYKDE